MGKTAFALACARNAALASQNPVNCVIFSLEMERKQLMHRLLSSEAGVDLQRMRRGTMTQDECLRVEEVGHILGTRGHLDRRFRFLEYPGASGEVQAIEVGT